MSSQNVGGQLISDDDRRRAFFALSFRIPSMKPWGSGFIALATMGRSSSAANSEHAVVPVVRHEAEADARGSRFRKPNRHIARHRVGVARQDGVVDVEQRVAQPEGEQIALDVDVGDAREIALRSRKPINEPASHATTRLRLGVARTSR